MAKAQIVLDYNDSLNLIGSSMADKLRKFNKRLIFSPGLTNQYILKGFGIDDQNNLKGCIESDKLTSNKINNGVYILHEDKINFLTNEEVISLELTSDDIYIKGANTLEYRDEKFLAYIFSAASDLGTYKNIYMKAIAGSSNVYIPVSLDKLVPNLNINEFNTHNDINFFRGEFSVIQLPMFYGQIFTEYDAFLEKFSLKSRLLGKGSSKDVTLRKIFLIEGDEESIKQAINFFNSTRKFKDE